MNQNRCRARDMVYGRCQLQRRHDGPHAIVDGNRRFIWKENSATLEYLSTGQATVDDVNMSNRTTYRS